MLISDFQSNCTISIVSGESIGKSQKREASTDFTHFHTHSQNSSLRFATLVIFPIQVLQWSVLEFMCFHCLFIRWISLFVLNADYSTQTIPRASPVIGEWFGKLAWLVKQSKNIGSKLNGVIISAISESCQNKNNQLNNSCSFKGFQTWIHYHYPYRMHISSNYIQFVPNALTIKWEMRIMQYFLAIWDANSKQHCHRCALQLKLEREQKTKLSNRKRTKNHNCVLPSTKTEFFNERMHMNPNHFQTVHSILHTEANATFFLYSEFQTKITHPTSVHIVCTYCVTWFESIGKN